jgi:hypothetical protein
MKPLSIIRFGANDFGANVSVCLGWQVARIILAIEYMKPGMQWHIADIETTGFQYAFKRSPIPTRIGGYRVLIKSLLEVEQFLSGVFAGVSQEIAHPRFRSGGLWTDDDEFADLGDATVEVRAFDTSYISVASEDDVLLNWIKRSLSQNG